MRSRQRQCSVAGADELVGEGDGVDAGEAHFVDAQGGDVHGDAALHRGLARRHLTLAGQGCALGTRLVVHESVYDELVADKEECQGQRGLEAINDLANRLAQQQGLADRARFLQQDAVLCWDLGGGLAVEEYASVARTARTLRWWASARTASGTETSSLWHTPRAEKASLCRSRYCHSRSCSARA